jgi:hypothetical protein
MCRTLIALLDICPNDASKSKRESRRINSMQNFVISTRPWPTTLKKAGAIPGPQRVSLCKNLSFLL